MGVQPLYLANNAQFSDTFGGDIQYASLAVKAHSAAWTRAEYLGLTGQLIEFGDYAIDRSPMFTGENYLAAELNSNFTGLTGFADTDIFTGKNNIGIDSTILTTGVNALSNSLSFSAQNELASIRESNFTGQNDLKQYGEEKEIMFTGAIQTGAATLFTCQNDILSSKIDMFTGAVALFGHDTDNDLMFTGFGSAGTSDIFTGQNEIAEAVNQLFTSGNILAGTGQWKMFTGGNSLADESEFEMIFTGSNRIGGATYTTETEIPAESQIIGNASFVQPIQVYINGIEVSEWHMNLRISCNIDNVHNEITIDGLGKAIFDIADPSGKPQIHVDIGNRSRFFLIESRIGDDERCTIWGRSLSCLDDLEDTLEEYIRIEEDEQIMASAAAASVLTENPLTWNAVDWLLPVGFQVSGKPLEIVARIAKTVGAVIIPKDGLGISVEKRKSVRPINAQITMPDLEYDDLSIFQGDSTEFVKGDNYDNVEILSSAAAIELPDIEVEPMPEGMQRIIGTESFIRVWPGAGSGIDVLEGFVTSGDIEHVGETETIENQRVEFQKTQGNVSYPITSLREITWEGNSGGLYSFEPGSKSITIGNDYAVADVEYATTYHRYRLIGHNVMTLIAGMYVEADENAAAIIAHGNQNPAPAITDSAIPEVAIMIERGTAYLDEQYDVFRHKFRSVYQGKLDVAGIVHINDSKVGNRGNYYVSGYDIISAGPKLVQEVTVEKCQL